MKDKKLFIVLIAICILTVFPFLGESLFQSKGEPREAIVAYSMLDTGNWILPVNNGGDIAYKPPFFHWCIAAVSQIGGQITEYTSRLPSAIAMIIMTLGIYLFYAKRKKPNLALLTALITLTAFEVHRGGWACRVDMVLTLFIVAALLQFYQWYERNEKGIPFWAIIWMGCATLTKGPVGIILPCLVTGVFLLIKGRSFISVAGKLILTGIISCILPAIWYVAAYQQGGDNFLALVMEENFGRFMGKMSYGSHEHGFHYNFLTVLSGYVPYTLLALLALPMAIKNLKTWEKPKHWWNAFKNYIKTMDSARLFTLLSIVLIFVFYCIPKSKRSTYLLPIYPFIAYFMAEFIYYLIQKKECIWKLYGQILAIVGILPIIAFFLIKGGIVSNMLTPSLSNSSFGQIINIIETTPIDTIHWLYILLPLIATCIFIRSVRNKRPILYPVMGIIFTIYMSLDGVILPEVLNAKSDKPIAEAIQEKVPEGNIYGYISSDMMRFFTVNFYLGNRVLQFEIEKPEKGYLLIGPHDYEPFAQRYSDYQFEEVYRSEKKSCDTKAPIIMYRFEKKAQ